MNNNIKNKLLHFYTSGNIYEDFAEARTKKTAGLRQIIRACFYVHCAAAIICIALAAVLRAGLGIITVTVCEIVLTTLAFLAVGDMMLMKTLLYCGDILFAAAMFVTGALGSIKTPFFAVGTVSVIAALIALAAFFAAACKIFLESFSPLSLLREHYTLLHSFSSDADVPETVPDKTDKSDKIDVTDKTDSTDKIDTNDKTDTPDKSDKTDVLYTPQIAPPPRSEFQELADKLKEVFHKPKNKKAYENTNVKTASEHTAQSEQSKTEVS